MSRLALKYVRQHHTACPYYGDGVMEFIKGRSIVRYFHKSTLEHVFKNGWTPKTDVLVEAQWQLSMHDGPLKPPPPVSGKVKKARGK
ncbi:MAG: hypothetical protein KF760_17905 [Candidatus Eremiobacteraeota bacterium]|nr:hypothetical protein [Candidatus Eremiobacteraeota bacterium]MCW5869256.1 hypothetical protein [Candidatus Eremiobacteraeota bacterium]